MEMTAVLPEAMAEACVADIPVPDTPYVDPVTREAIDLLFECDRVDAMSDTEEQKKAMDALMERVIEFESVVPGSAQRAILDDALAVLS
ncbi:MAG: hypothetical protein HOE48_09175 [Candidatus Latescibacteria bacterium]|jgi:hypothetical protein|nr:hypothetical protein [Candidatus Latescibacterota bacterium]MBT4138075.1 hypothetical protein [Candidatus Latescibacterota bacterium]MBT5832858.1 hypothetical protein [Candidatus Latescibacterota bacterium]